MIVDNILGALKYVAQQIFGIWDFTAGIKTDSVAESNAGSGVTIDSLTLIKDGSITSGNGANTSNILGRFNFTSDASYIHLYGQNNNTGTRVSIRIPTGTGAMYLNAINTQSIYFCEDLDVIARIDANGLTGSAGKVLSFDADGDTCHILGRAKIGFDGTNSDSACFGHYDKMTAGQCGLRQDANGDTIFQSGGGRYLYMRVGGATTAEITSTGLTGTSGKVLSFPTIKSNFATDADSDTDDVLSTGITGVAGMLVLNCDGKSGLYRVDESNNLSAIDADSDFSVTKDTASHYNLYYETDQFKLQNKVGNDKAIAVGIYIA